MQAVRFENRTIVDAAVPVPEPGPEEALVRILTAGICATDRAVFNGYAAFSGIPGHEFAGVVETCLDHPGIVGKRVAADINIGCGRCKDERHCPERKVIGIRGKDGSFAEYCTVPVKNLRSIPESVSIRHAVFAEPLAAALRIADQNAIGQNTRVAVAGDGCMGILCALALSCYSKKVVLLGRHPEKLNIAKQQGVDTFPAAADASPEDIRRELGSFDVTVDAAGSASGIGYCISLARPEGTVVVKTTRPRHTAVDLSAVVVNELTIRGSRCGNMDLALDFLKDRRIDVEPLITAVYPFSRFKEAFRRSADKGSLKILVEF